MWRKFVFIVSVLSTVAVGIAVLASGVRQTSDTKLVVDGAARECEFNLSYGNAYVIGVAHMLDGNIRADFNVIHGDKSQSEGLIKLRKGFCSRWNVDSKLGVRARCGDGSLEDAAQQAGLDFIFFEAPHFDSEQNCKEWATFDPLLFELPRGVQFYP